MTIKNYILYNYKNVFCIYCMANDVKKDATFKSDYFKLIDLINEQVEKEASELDFLEIDSLTDEDLDLLLNQDNYNFYKDK